MLDAGPIIVLSMITAQVWIILIQPEYILDWMGPVIDRIKWKRIHKLLTCSVCMAGQISFWSYIFCCHDYSLLTHFIVVIITIWITALTNKTFEL